MACAPPPMAMRERYEFFLFEGTPSGLLPFPQAPAQAQGPPSDAAASALTSVGTATCRLCNLTFAGHAEQRAHFKSAGHLARRRAVAEAPASAEAAAAPPPPQQQPVALPAAAPPQPVAPDAKGLARVGQRHLHVSRKTPTVHLSVRTDEQEVLRFTLWRSVLASATGDRNALKTRRDYSLQVRAHESLRHPAVAHLWRCPRPPSRRPPSSAALPPTTAACPGVRVAGGAVGAVRGGGSLRAQRRAGLGRAALPGGRVRGRHLRLGRPGAAAQGAAPLHGPPQAGRLAVRPGRQGKQAQVGTRAAAARAAWERARGRARGQSLAAHYPLPCDPASWRRARAGVAPL